MSTQTYENLTNNTLTQNDTTSTQSITGVFVTPEDFGATGDSTTHTAAFESMFSSIQTLLQADNQKAATVVLEQNKTYHVSSLELPGVSNLCIDGNNATIEFTSVKQIPNTTSYSNLVLCNANNITIKNLRIKPVYDDDEKGMNLCFINVDKLNLSNVVCDNVLVNQDDATEAIWTKEGMYISDCKNVHISKCSLHGTSSGMGIKLSRTNNVTIDNCYIERCARGGIYLLNENSNVTVLNNELANNVNDFSQASDGAIDIYGSGLCENIKIVNNYIHGVANGTWDGETEKYKLAGCGIRIKSSRNVLCENNTIEITNDHTNYGIAVQPRYCMANEHIKIKNNYIVCKEASECSGETDTSVTAGIYVFGEHEGYTPLTPNEYNSIPANNRPVGYKVGTTDFEKIDAAEQADVYFVRYLSDDANNYNAANNDIEISNNTVLVEKFYAVPVTSNVFTPNKIYAKQTAPAIDGVHGGFTNYIPLNLMPDDWDTNYTQYYCLGTNSNIVAAILFRHSCSNVRILNNTIGSKAIPFPGAGVQFKTGASDFATYQRLSGTVPTFKERIYYAPISYELLTAAPKDWESNYSNYYELVLGEYVRISAKPAAFAANTYYAMSEATMLMSVPNNWATNYTDYFKRKNHGSTQFYREFTVSNNQIYSRGIGINANNVLNSEFTHNKMHYMTYGISVLTCKNICIDTQGIHAHSRAFVKSSKDSSYPESLQTQNVYSHSTQAVIE